MHGATGDDEAEEGSSSSDGVEGQAGAALHEGDPATKKCKLYAWPPVRLSKASSAAELGGVAHGDPLADDHGVTRTAHDVIRHGSGSRNRWTVTVHGNEAHPTDQLIMMLRGWGAAPTTGSLRRHSQLD